MILRLAVLRYVLLILAFAAGSISVASSLTGSVPDFLPRLKLDPSPEIQLDAPFSTEETLLYPSNKYTGLLDSHLDEESARSQYSLETPPDERYEAGVWDYRYQYDKQLLELLANRRSELSSLMGALALELLVRISREQYSQAVSVYELNGGNGSNTGSSDEDGDKAATDDSSIAGRMTESGESAEGERAASDTTKKKKVRKKKIKKKTEMPVAERTKEDIVTELNDMLEEHRATRATVDQHMLLQKFYTLVKQLLEKDHELKPLFHSEDFDGIPYVMLAPKGIIKLLNQRFSAQMKSRRLNYVLVNPRMESINLELFQALTGQTLESMDFFLFENPMMISQLTLPRMLINLTAYFVNELHSMTADSRRVYLIDNFQRHKVVIHLRRREEKSFRVLVADSLNAFKPYDTRSNQAFDSNIIVLALMAAFEHEEVSDAQFHYFATERQKGVEGCLMFALRDAEVLLKNPPVPSAPVPYKIGRERELPPMAVWSPVLKGAAKSEATGIGVNSEVLVKIGSNDEGRIMKVLEDTIGSHLDVSEGGARFFSDKYTFRHLLKFPLGFLDLTESTQSTARLTKEMTPSHREGVKHTIQMTSGYFSIKGDLKKRNLAAKEQYMQTILELISGLSVEASRQSEADGER